MNNCEYRGPDLQNPEHSGETVVFQMMLLKIKSIQRISAASFMKTCIS